MPKKLTDSGTQPLETMTLAEGWPELTAGLQGLGQHCQHRFKIDPLVNFSSPQNLMLPAPAHRPFSCR